MSKLLKPLGTGKKILTEKEVLDEIEALKTPESKITGSLEQKVQAPENMPMIRLKKIESTVVQTITLEEYTTLMQIYECAGWMWNGSEIKDAPLTGVGFWQDYKKNTHIDAATPFSYGMRITFEDNEYEIISFKEFCKAENITQSMIDEITKYFSGKVK